MRTAARVGFYSLLLTLAALVTITRVGPALAGLTPISLTGQSMSGTMDMGSLVYLDATRTPRVGNIVTFDHAGRLWTHRVIEQTHSLGSYDETRWQTKGDAMPEPDPFVVNPTEIKGIAVGNVPYIGYAALFLQQPATWLLVTTLALTLYWKSKEGAQPE